MKAEIKTRWTTALRSGEYEQATGNLCLIADGKAKFCCLGVLCELAVKDGILPAGKVNSCGEVGYAPGVHGEWEYAVLPAVVREWAGLDDPNPYIGDIAGWSGGITASDANDTHELTFPEIADLIDANIPADA